MARRLVEAGVRVVSVSISDFDTHSKNFPRMRNLVPIVDHALATLEADLRSRGLLDEVLVVAWGEFGRTPKVNSKGGRTTGRACPRLLCSAAVFARSSDRATDKIAGECTDARSLSRRHCHNVSALGIKPQRRDRGRHHRPSAIPLRYRPSDWNFVKTSFGRRLDVIVAGLFLFLLVQYAHIEAIVDDEGVRFHAVHNNTLPPMVLCVPMTVWPPRMVARDKWSRDLQWSDAVWCRRVVGRRSGTGTERYAVVSFT